LHITIDPAEAWPAGALGPVFEVRPSGTRFAVPATFVYRFQPTDIAPVAASDVRFGVAEGSSWRRLPTTVVSSMFTAAAQTTHLSTYGLVGPEDPGVGEARSARYSRCAPRARRSRSRRRWSTATSPVTLPRPFRLSFAGVAVGPEWSVLPTTVDASMNVVTAQTTHLSTYGLIRANQVDAGSTHRRRRAFRRGCLARRNHADRRAGRDGPPPAKP
jgi:hypothetical protein